MVIELDKLVRVLYNETMQAKLKHIFLIVSFENGYFQKENAESMWEFER